MTISLHTHSRAIAAQYCFPYSRFFTTSSLSAGFYRFIRCPIRRRLDRDIKKKVLRAGCLAQLWSPRAANCPLPGLITSLCYSVNARRKPLCLPRLNSRLAYICIYITTHTYHLNASSRTRHKLAIAREREKKPPETTGKTPPDAVWKPRRDSLFPVEEILVDKLKISCRICS